MPDVAATFAAALDEWQASVSKRMLSASRMFAPKVRGDFAASLYAVNKNEGGNRAIEIHSSSTRPMMSWVIGGTRPHMIFPVRAQTLAWPSYPGRQLVGTMRVAGHARMFDTPGEADYTFARSVHHPGTKPNVMWGKQTRDAVLPFARSSLGDVLRKAISAGLAR